MYGRQEAQAGRALAVEKAMNMKIKKVKFHKMLQIVCTCTSLQIE